MTPMASTVVIHLRQALVIAVGLALAAGMVVLGTWQLDVYRAQGANMAVRRASGPPVRLHDVAPVNAAVSDGYGRPVRFTGSYVPDLQIFIPIDGRPGAFRVLTGLRQDDGSIVAVVRGQLAGPASDRPRAPAPPTIEVDQVGVLLPSEEAIPSDATGELTSVRLPALAQRWPGPLLGGFVTLSEANARAQGLTPAAVTLPEARGRLRNGAYALQWWLFAAFTVAMALRMARDFGRYGWTEPAQVASAEPLPSSDESGTG